MNFTVDLLSYKINPYEDENVRKAETLARKAEQELLDGNYTFEQKYVEEFRQEDYIYTLNNGESMQIEMDALYTEFADWLASWEV